MKKILLVDDVIANLTACKKALKGSYEVYTVTSAEKMFEVLEHVIPDLILMDVEMPGMNGYDTMRKMHSFDAYKDIPVIFVSAMDDAESELVGLDLGAVDYIHKPFTSSLLNKRIERHLSNSSSKVDIASEIEEPLDKIIEMIEAALKTYNIDDIRHCLYKADVEARIMKEIFKRRM